MSKHKQVYINLTQLEREPSILKMAISDRNDGKTTELVRLAVGSFDSCGKSAVFCRRYQTEMPDAFFTEFEKALKVHPQTLNGRDFDFVKPSKNKLGALLLEPNDSDKKRPAVTFTALTKAGRLKSAIGYATHRNIYIDEYLPLDGRYLPKEVDAMLELYKTIDRNQYENYIMIAGNKITRFNPVFEYFNIKQWKKGLNSFQNGQFSLLVYSNPSNATNAKKSPFGDLVSGTKYESYNAGEFLRTYDELLKSWHSRNVLLYVAHGGKVYALFQSEADAVFDYARGTRATAPVVCVEPQPASAGAVWLDALPKARKMLERFKYMNMLYFADEMILNALKKVYTSI